MTQMKPPPENPGRFKLVKFADGTVWTATDLLQRATGATPGDDILYGSSGSETLAGLAGNDTLYGRQGDDTFIGGAGNDILSGEGGNDTYRFGIGDGQDIVREYIDSFAGGTYGTDTIELDDGIAPSDVTVSQADNGNDIVLSIVGTSDQITIDQTVNDSRYRIEQVRFADGTIWTVADLMTRATAPTNGADTYSGGYDAETISGGAGDDNLRGRDGSDVLIGGTGNDLLRGEGGNDTYRFSLGDGQDIIRDYVDAFDGGANGTDTIEFGPGISPTDVTVVQADAGNDIVLRINGTTDQITIDQTVNDSRNRIEQVRFADGTIWTAADLMTRATAPTSGADTFSGGYDAETISGGAGDDSLRGRDGSDVLIGGTGNDLLRGEGGNDTYRFSLGDGQDIIRDYVDAFDGGANGTDTIEFGPGISPTDVTVVQADSGNDIVLKINGTTDQITIDQTVNDSRYRIEQVRFADGTILNHAQLLAIAITPTSGDDLIYLGTGNDVIAGGAGNDTIDGGGGNDTFQFTGTGDGFDAITGGAGTDTIQAMANNTVIGLRSLATVEAITAGAFAGVMISGSAAADTLNFTGITLTGIGRIDGGAGADTITAPATAATIAGGGGDDTITGGAGNDTFQFTGIGEGFDAITGGAGTDTVQAMANNTVIGLRSLATVETISAGSYTGVTITGSSGADTLNFTGVTLTGISRIAGGAGNDIITGPAAAMTFAGDAGDDTITGGAGNDTFQFTGAGEGFDAITGGAGTDTIQALANDTVIGLHSIATIEAISAGAFTGVTIAGSAAANTLNFTGVTLTGIGRIDGGAGNDIITGSAGNDTLIGGAGTDTLNGAAGIDTADYGYLSTGLTLSLAVTTAQTIATGDSDTLSNIENVTGGGGNDILTGAAGDNVLSGGSGDDRLSGGLGNDQLLGGIGTDSAIFTGESTTYSVSTLNGVVRIVDNATTVDGNDGTDTIAGIEQLIFKNNVTVGVTSPIILDLDGGGVTMVAAADSRARFDLNGDGRADDTSWIGNTEGFLFLDRDGNGTVTNAGELSFIDDVPGATSDLAGLKAFDSDNDHILSSADAKFNSFRVWRDGNEDGVIDSGEVMSLTEAGVLSINLQGTAVNANSNFGEVAVLNTGSYTRTNGTTMQFVDAALTYFSAPAQIGARRPPLGHGQPGGMLRHDPAALEEIDRKLHAAIAALSGSDAANTIADIYSLTDAEAFGRYSRTADGSAVASFESAPSYQHTHDRPVIEVSADAVLANQIGDLSLGVFGMNSTESSRLLTLLRQEMAGFGASSARERINWKMDNSLNGGGLAYL